MARFDRALARHSGAKKSTKDLLNSGLEKGYDCNKTKVVEKNNGEQSDIQKKKKRYNNAFRQVFVLNDEFDDEECANLFDQNMVSDVEDSIQSLENAVEEIKAKEKR